MAGGFEAIHLHIDPDALRRGHGDTVALAAVSRARDVLLGDALRDLLLSAARQRDNRNLAGILEEISRHLVHCYGRDCSGQRAGAIGVLDVRSIQGRVERSLRSGLPVNELASAARLSRSHFTRAYTEVFGMPPHHHLMRLRIERAKHALSAMGARSAEITHRLGFADQSHFTRLFKQYTGSTPADYQTETHRLLSRWR